MKYLSEETEPRTVTCNDCDEQPVLTDESGFLVACHSHEIEVTASVASSNLLQGGRWDLSGDRIVCEECGERPYLVTDPYGPIGGYAIWCDCERYIELDSTVGGSELTATIVGPWTQFDGIPGGNH